ncbi:MAG: hypothetical protein KAY24_00770 [Candidatus Eisenbacteria sp.]|nr:hypothetical protein [Candidatus Eisenbacteria bacterium]
MIHGIPDRYPQLRQAPPSVGRLVALPVRGGIQHDYRLVVWAGVWLHANMMTDQDTGAPDYWNRCYPAPSLTTSRLSRVTCLPQSKRKLLRSVAKPVVLPGNALFANRGYLLLPADMQPSYLDLLLPADMQPSYLDLVSTFDECLRSALRARISYSDDAADSLFTRCGLPGRLADQPTSGAAHQGGGVYFEDSAADLVNCDFVGNSAEDDGGGIYMADPPCVISLAGCVVTDNTAGDEGGGIYSTNDVGAVTITGCESSDNWALHSAGGVRLGGNPSISHSTFGGNTSENGNGGAVRIEGNGTVNGCTFIHNYAHYGGGIHFAGGTPTLSSGFDLMYDRLLTSGRVAPVVSEGVDSVHVVVRRRAIHAGVVRLIAEADHRYQLTQRERIALGLLGQTEGLSAAELTRALELPDPASLQAWISRLLDLGLVEQSGRTRATRYFVPANLLQDVDLDGPTTLRRIEPHWLRALILEDVTRYPDSAASAIHRRVGAEIPERTFRRGLEDLVSKGLLTAVGERCWRRYRPGAGNGREDDDGR